MILRFLNWQGVVGIAIGIAFAALLVIQKIETGHWKKRSASFEQLYRQEQASLAATIANAAPLRIPLAPPTRPMPPASLPSSARSTKGPRMTLKPVLPLLALLLPISFLSACASSPKPQPIPVLAETHQCPAFPLPPPALLKAPAKTDFLPTMH